MKRLYFSVESIIWSIDLVSFSLVFFGALINIKFDLRVASECHWRLNQQNLFGVDCTSTFFSISSKTEERHVINIFVKDKMV